MAFGESPVALSADDGSRYADFVLDAARNRVIAVREDHAASDIDAVSTIAALSLSEDSPGAITTLVSGRDFYSNPRLSPDGTQICWLEWDHPNMPWDGCELWTATFTADGSLSCQITDRWRDTGVGLPAGMGSRWRAPFRF